MIGDRITILRDGVKINTVGINDCSNEELVNMMVGRSVEQVYARTENKHEGITLKTENLCDYNGRVRNVSFTVGKGEIVGLAGLVGAGRTETAELLYGIEKIKSGKVYVRGNQVFPKSPVQAVRIGIGLVSEDRKSRDLLWTSQLLSIWWQSVSKRYFRTSLYQKENYRSCAGI